MEDVDMSMKQADGCLPSRPVLEMALNLDQFKLEVKRLIDAGNLKDLAYVLLKIAMEI